jgi:putative DNA primase/helicase
MTKRRPPRDPETEALVEKARALGLGDQIPDTDVANARRLAQRYGEAFRFTVEAGWFAWDGRRWARDEKGVRIQAAAVETARSIFDEIKDSPKRDAVMVHAKRSQSRRSIESMVVLCRSEEGIPIPITDFDADPWVLNLANGTYDLKRWFLRTHRRGDLISKIVEVQFDAEASCPRWLEFIGRVTDGNGELIAYLQRFVGHLLAGDTSEQCLHFLYGLGANGKSVFCEVILRLLGDYAIAAGVDMVMLKRVGGIPNDIARLRGIRAALMNETAQGSRFDESKLKDLTGSDTISGRFLHQEFFHFNPTHRIVIRGNHKPTIDGTDEGIWRRLRLIPFTVSIPQDEQDRDLLRKLEHELSGILNWAIAGCKQWQDQGLNPPSIVMEAAAKYREESDVLGRFIEECCEVRPLAQVKSSALFKRYQNFAEASGERWIPSKDFPGELERRGFHKARRAAGFLFQGLELRIDQDDDRFGTLN